MESAKRARAGSSATAGAMRTASAPASRAAARIAERTSGAMLERWDAPAPFARRIGAVDLRHVAGIELQRARAGIFLDVRDFRRFRDRKQQRFARDERK